jgi:hypothetical protein
VIRYLVVPDPRGLRPLPHPTADGRCVSQTPPSGIKSRYDTARSLQGVGALTKISPLEGHPDGTSRPSARSAEPPPATTISSPTR